MNLYEITTNHAIEYAVAKNIMEVAKVHPRALHITCKYQNVEILNTPKHDTTV